MDVNRNIHGQYINMIYGKVFDCLVFYIQCDIMLFGTFLYSFLYVDVG